MTPHEREARRQQLLLRALWRDDPPADLPGWLRGAPARQARGLAAYQAGAGALAERALAAAFPTVAAIVGEPSFGALARACWRAEAPQRGDIGTWGEGLAGFIAGDPQLAAEPYLADVARLDWAVHVAERAPDPQPPQGLERLADADVAWLRLQPGTALVVSAHPVVTIWQAHRSEADDRFAPVRAAFAAGRGESALVWRQGWRAQVRVLAAPEACFVGALLAGRPLASALDDAGEGFDFTAWLVGALQDGAIAGLDLDPRA